jgi:hypothetical protein
MERSSVPDGDNLTLARQTWYSGAIANPGRRLGVEKTIRGATARTSEGSKNEFSPGI